jgi:hypothetical protein
MDEKNIETLRYVDLPPAIKDFVELSPEENVVLGTVNQRVASGRNLADVMEFVFEATRPICPCDRLGLAFLDEDGARLVAHWARATYEPVLLGPGYAEDIGNGSLRRVIETGEPRIINDLSAYLAAHPTSASTALLVKEGVRSSMTCPLVVDGRRVGVMFRSSRRPAAYDEHQVRLHEALAERLAQAVEKAYRIDQLAAANRAYGEMLSFVSHELKSPLSSIVMDGRVLLGNFLGVVPPEQADQVARMVRKAEYLLTLVRDYLDLARIESGDLALRAQPAVDLARGLIEPAIELLHPQIEDRAMRLIREVPTVAPPVECDPDLLQIALANLLSNAVKYGDHGGDITVRAALGPDRFSLSVRNQGPGFPASERSRLFRKFSRLQTPELLSRRGSGVGLYTCWRIARLHGGSIHADSEVGQWAQFTIEIPQPLRPASGNAATALQTSG